LPIITTEAATEDAFKDRQNVFFVPPGDATALAAAIGAVMDDDGLRRQLREGAAELARTWFSWETVLDRTVEALGASTEAHVQ
jgi:glycosyltransferase involved in cell wall biosynthesis